MRKAVNVHSPHGPGMHWPTKGINKGAMSGPLPAAGFGFGRPAVTWSM